jgi:hypothetical protein
MVVVVVMFEVVVVLVGVVVGRGVAGGLADGRDVGGAEVGPDDGDGGRVGAGVAETGVGFAAGTAPSGGYRVIHATSTALTPRAKADTSQRRGQGVERASIVLVWNESRVRSRSWIKAGTFA